MEFRSLFRKKKKPLVDNYETGTGERGN